MSLFIICVLLGGFIIVRTMRAGSSDSTTSNGLTSKTSSAKSTQWGPAEAEGVTLNRPWWPQLDRIGIELYDVRTKDPQKLVGQIIGLEAWWDDDHNPFKDDLYREIEFKGGKVVRVDDKYDTLFSMSRIYKNAEQKLGLICRWSGDKISNFDGDGKTWSMRLDVFTLTQPFPWHRDSKTDPNFIGLQAFRNIIKNTTDPEEIATLMEEKIDKNTRKLERAAAKVKE
jgi:hypothetical protein